jgi:hypothetical protein
MLAECRTNTNVGVGLGIILQIVSGRMDGFLGLIIGLAGTAAFLWGCFNYAKGKGYPSLLGLLGLLSCIGLLILVVLPDKHKYG